MELLKGNDPLLKQVCPEFDFENGYFVETGVSMDAKDLYELLRDEMIKHRGVGLAAPQLEIGRAHV